jgi:hypothetical protein
VIGAHFTGANNALANLLSLTSYITPQFFAIQDRRRSLTNNQ